MLFVTHREAQTVAAPLVSNRAASSKTENQPLLLWEHTLEKLSYVYPCGDMYKHAHLGGLRKWKIRGNLIVYP